jgi:hypothetical protein
MGKGAGSGEENFWGMFFGDGWGCYTQIFATYNHLLILYNKRPLIKS